MNLTELVQLEELQSLYGRDTSVHSEGQLRKELAIIKVSSFYLRSNSAFRNLKPTQVSISDKHFSTTLSGIIAAINPFGFLFLVLVEPKISHILADYKYLHATWYLFFVKYILYVGE